MTTRHIFGMSLLVIVSGASVAEPLGNTTITSFNTAKKIMQQHVYTTPQSCVKPSLAMPHLTRKKKSRSQVVSRPADTKID